MTIHAASAAIRAGERESDPRLQADGQDWRLDQARIRDAARPRVLLIGDSILNGYGKTVIKALEGRAYVDLWVTPACQSEYTNKLLAQVLDHGPYELVHFNLGLHGWPEGRIKEGTFQPLTRAMVDLMREKKPDTKVIWASTTPVTVKDHPTELEPTINPIIIDHNRMAADVMHAANVPVNDFYGLLSDKRHLARGDMFHWNAQAYKLLADTVVASIERELKLPPSDDERQREDVGAGRAGTRQPEVHDLLGGRGSCRAGVWSGPSARREPRPPGHTQACLVPAAMLKSALLVRKLALPDTRKPVLCRFEASTAGAAGTGHGRVSTRRCRSPIFWLDSVPHRFQASLSTSPTMALRGVPRRQPLK